MMMNTTEVSVVFRPAIENDWKFIRLSWQNHYKKDPSNTFVPTPIYKQRQSLIIARLIARGAKVLIACNSQDLNQIFGWICYESIDKQTVVHYILVKSIFRKQGIGEELLSQISIKRHQKIVVSHAMYYVCKQLENKFPVVLLPQLTDFERQL